MRYLILYFFAFSFFSATAQPGTVNSSKGTYTLPDLKTVPAAGGVISALGVANVAAQDLTADAEKEKAKEKQAETEFNNADKLKQEYLTSLESYNKNGHDPYIEDHGRYTINNDKYKSVLADYTAQVNAYNSASQKSQAEYDRLMKWKSDIGDWNSKLTGWQGNLVSWKEKLDKEREGLLGKKGDYEKAQDAALSKLRDSEIRLGKILNDLLRCKKYGDECLKILNTKFKVNYTGKYSQTIFGQKEYKASVDDLNTTLERIKKLWDTPWDGRKEN